jgi:hypothetical protein
LIICEINGAWVNSSGAVLRLIISQFTEVEIDSEKYFLSCINIILIMVDVNNLSWKHGNWQYPLHREQKNPSGHRWRPEGLETKWEKHHCIITVSGKISIAGVKYCW